ncbi:MAG: hypothetical protein H6748_21285 [Spirochaetaceae bacterium]|nr:hypothetical protein [Myxococcales bacterium]MCB9726594.1 hypothetical protein [Spirochaetaceae bacterium]
MSSSFESTPSPARAPRSIHPGLRSPAFFIALAAALLLAAADHAHAQSGQTAQFGFDQGFVGLLPLDQAFPGEEVALGVADLFQTGGAIEATLWSGEGFAFTDATAPGFAIFDRTLRVNSTLDPAAGRYQLRFGVRRLRAGLRDFQDFAGARFIQYDRIRGGRIRFERIRSDLRASLLRAQALDRQSGRVRFERFAQQLRVMRYDKDGARWLPAYERVGERYQPIRFFGRRASWTPGHYGFDVQNALVWSVQDGDGAYALGFPVPEPGLLAMVGAGSLAIVGIATQRRARARRRHSA